MAICKAALFALLCVAVSKAGADDSVITIDDAPGMGRMFDGIGGLSGGGVSARLIETAFLLLNTSSGCSALYCYNRQ